MQTKERINALLETLPDDCSLEDVQYHLYVMAKVERGLQRAETEGTLKQEEVEARLAKWDSR